MNFELPKVFELLPIIAQIEIIVHYFIGVRIAFPIPVARTSSPLLNLILFVNFLLLIIFKKGSQKVTDF